VRSTWIAVASAWFAVQTFVPAPAISARPASGTQTVSQGTAAETARLPFRIGVARADGGYTVVTVPLEAYVARVLTGEALPDSPPAAFEALAIAVRTYTLANRGRHAVEGFDLCDQTHCQVMRAATAATERAASATTGLVLLDGGKPASIYYSASCGGRTEIPSEVWPGHEDPPFLPSKDDDGCGGAPIWTTQLAERDLLRALHAGGFRGDRLRGLRILSRNASGRVAKLRLEGLEPDEISGPDLRAVVGRTLGWQHIKSTSFELKREADGYRLNGHGSGHGVGMCVIGAARLARRGEGTVDILRRYYPGLTIAAPTDASTPVATSLSNRSTRMATPGSAPVVSARSAAPVAVVPELLISLPEGDEGERPFVSGLTARARTDIARALAVDAPRVMLRFHPTVESYEQASGKPWFTSAAVINGDIHLLPPAVLRQRGGLEQAMRHGLVHVMTDGALGRRPLWVREGAAIYFSGELGSRGERPTRMPVLQPRLSCPDDADLRRPVSAGALSNDYARAHACFARQITSGRAWQDVR